MALPRLPDLPKPETEHTEKKIFCIYSTYLMTPVFAKALSPARGAVTAEAGKFKLSRTLSKYDFIQPGLFNLLYLLNMATAIILLNKARQICFL